MRRTVLTPVVGGLLVFAACTPKEAAAPSAGAVARAELATEPVWGHEARRLHVPAARLRLFGYLG